MIVYNVTISIDNEIADGWIDYMKSTHIPDVMATGCFTEFLFTRILSRQPDEDGQGFSIQYRCESMEKYDQYRHHHAARLQEEHSQRFDGRFVAFRTLLEEVEG